MRNQIKTRARTLLNYIEEANEMALNTDIEVNISFQTGREDSTVEFTFFKDGKNYSITLYQFWERTKNDKFFKIAKSIIKNRDNFEKYTSSDFH